MNFVALIDFLDSLESPKKIPLITQVNYSHDYVVEIMVQPVNGSKFLHKKIDGCFYRDSRPFVQKFCKNYLFLKEITREHEGSVKNYQDKNAFRTTVDKFLTDCAVYGLMREVIKNPDQDFDLVLELKDGRDREGSRYFDFECIYDEIKNKVYFNCVDLYNSELKANYDIFSHAIFK